jgi:predicted AAA+ superfamily ATPase
MVERPFWVGRIEQAWARAPIAWLSGVRRVGKTTLARSFEASRYLNCDLPSAAEVLRDPEPFFDSVREPIVILDEVHQLPDPSRLLKIAADAYPHLKILATGSSTLAATGKFRDALTGRKREVHLLPVLAEELPLFGIGDVKDRLWRGGLPQALLSSRDPELYAEWLDSFFARDIQELFRVEKRTGFLLLLETILRQSGGLIEVTSLAKACGLSRPTILNYLNVLQVTHAIVLLRPYHRGGRRELLQQPKVYGFDTGFVVHAHGWNDLRVDDCGLLWEHLVLDTLRSLAPPANLHFWRDKQQREVDFVVPRARGTCDALECKWRASGFDPRGLIAFRTNYPKGRNLVVTPEPREPYGRKIGELDVQFTSLSSLRGLLAA